LQQLFCWCKNKCHIQKSCTNSMNQMRKGQSALKPHEPNAKRNNQTSNLMNQMRKGTIRPQTSANYAIISQFVYSVF